MVYSLHQFYTYLGLKYGFVENISVKKVGFTSEVKE